MDGDAPSHRQRAREIGERVAKARRESGGMTQKDLAQQLGISARTVQAYEQGEIIPYKNLRPLESLLGRPAAWFLYGDDALQATDEQHAETVALLRDLHMKVDQILRRL